MMASRADSEGMHDTVNTPTDQSDPATEQAGPATGQSSPATEKSGPVPKALTDMPRAGWIAILKRSVREFKHDDVTDRAAALTQKTNQFNLTLRRHTREQIAGLADDPAAVCLTLELEDRFARHGTIGLGILVPSESDPATAEIDTLLLSCRVIGRTAELHLLSHLAREAIARGYTRLRGTYVEGPRNAAVVWTPRGPTGPGGPTDQYVKRHLLPFGEYIPLRGLASFFSGDVARVVDFAPGSGTPTLDAGPARVLTSVACLGPPLPRAPPSLNTRRPSSLDPRRPPR